MLRRYLTSYPGTRKRQNGIFRLLSWLSANELRPRIESLDSGILQPGWLTYKNRPQDHLNNLSTNGKKTKCPSYLKDGQRYRHTRENSWNEDSSCESNMSIQFAWRYDEKVMMKIKYDDDGEDGKTTITIREMKEGIREVYGGEIKSNRLLL